MALTCHTNSFTASGTPTTSSNAAAAYSGSYAGGSGEGTTKYFQWGIGNFANEQNDGTSFLSDVSWSNSTPASLLADTTYQGRAAVVDSLFGTKFGNPLFAKMNAKVASTQTPGSASVTASTATISCGYTPNVAESACSAQLQYKKTTDVSWTNAGSPQTTGGYSATSVSRDITGLDASTQYQVRLVLTRTTNNGTSVTSATASFTTLAGEPLVTTNAASGVAATSANLNGSLDINEGTSVQVYFEYGTDSGLAGASSTTPVSESADTSFGTSISGLTANTTYYFRAVVTFSTPSGSPNTGSILSFTTPADPAADALLEDHVTIFDFNERKYGVESTFYFAVSSPAATSSDRFFNAASPFVDGDVQVSKDGGSFANVGTLPTRVGTTAIFSLTLSAAEMQATTIIVQIVDQDGPAFRDAALVIRTAQELGKVDVDASQLTDTSAFKVTGVGSGHGIEAVGGATGRDIDGIIAQHYQRVNTAQAGASGTVTLDASASATNDYYNGSVIEVIAGTGAGQARVITDYDGSTKVATVDTSWATNPSSDSVFLIRGGSRPWDLSPGVELSAIPTAASGFGKLMQFVFQRFAYKITQTATVQTLYKADSSTSLGTRSASDNGTTQSLGKVS